MARSEGAAGVVGFGSVVVEGEDDRGRDMTGILVGACPCKLDDQIVQRFSGFGVLALGGGRAKVADCPAQIRRRFRASGPVAKVLDGLVVMGERRLFERRATGRS